MHARGGPQIRMLRILPPHLTVCLLNRLLISNNLCDLIANTADFPLSAIGIPASTTGSASCGEALLIHHASTHENVHLPYAVGIEVAIKEVNQCRRL